MNREYAYDPNYAYRTTQVSNLPIEEQLRMKFADRGLGAVSANAARMAPQRPAQPMQSAQPRRQVQMYAAPQRPVQPMQQNRPVQQRPAQTAMPRPTQPRPMQPAQLRRSEPALPAVPQKKSAAPKVKYYEAKTTPMAKPTMALVALLTCTLTVLTLVMGAAMVSRASDEVSDLKHEAAELSSVERDLVQALDRKNDLRTIERIAVDELGMISTDLITKRFITSYGIDVIEAYDEEEKAGVGLSTLLAAIGIGVE